MTDTEAGTAVAEFQRVQHVEANPLEFFINRYDDFSRMAAQLAKSGMFRHKTGQAVGAILLYALEMGIPVTHALRGMYHTGKALGMEGQLMLGLARNRCGVTIKNGSIVRTEERYECVLLRPRPNAEDEEVPCSFTVQQAAKAGLIREKPDGTFEGKEAWDKWRADMLQWRAISQGLRVIAPDFFMNIYSAEEALAMQAERAEVQRYDASAELRDELGVVEHTVDDAIEEMHKLVGEVEKKHVGALSFDDRESVKSCADARDEGAITGWIDQLKEMLG